MILCTAINLHQFAPMCLYFNLFLVYQEIYKLVDFVANSRTKLFHALLRAIHAYEIYLHNLSRQGMFQDVFHKK